MDVMLKEFIESDPLLAGALSMIAVAGRSAINREPESSAERETQEDAARNTYWAMMASVVGLFGARSATPPGGGGASGTRSPPTTAEVMQAYDLYLRDVCLQAVAGEPGAQRTLPLTTTNLSPAQNWAFLRGALITGVVTGTASLAYEEGSDLAVVFRNERPHVLELLRRMSMIPATLSPTPLSTSNSNCKEYALRFRSANALDFLGEVFRGRMFRVVNARDDDQHQPWADALLGPVFDVFAAALVHSRMPAALVHSRMPGATAALVHSRMPGATAQTLPLPTLGVFRSDPAAVLPSKARITDVGFDLTIIKRHQLITNTTALFNTGIRVSIPLGFYVEVVPRSSLSKSGYMLTNSVGIIDPGYTGDILISLTKVDAEKPDVELPFRCCQLLLKRQEHCVLDEVSFNGIGSTQRGGGGFGSTGGGGQ